MDSKGALIIFNYLFVFIRYQTVATLLTLLRIPFLGRIGSISYVLPIRQNIDILNRDIRVKISVLVTTKVIQIVSR